MSLIFCKKIYDVFLFFCHLFHFSLSLSLSFSLLYVMCRTVGIYMMYSYSSITCSSQNDVVRYIYVVVYEYFIQFWKKINTSKNVKTGQNNVPIFNLNTLLRSWEELRNMMRGIEVKLDKTVGLKLPSKYSCTGSACSITGLTYIKFVQIIVSMWNFRVFIFFNK